MSAISHTFAPEDLFRLSVKQYHELIDRGILSSADRVELIEGVLVRKMSKNEPHIATTRRCRRKLEPLLPSGTFYETEQPILLSDSEPEPDGVIILGDPDDPALIKPKAADIALVIEVADTSLNRDIGPKLRSYARSGIVCYWIVSVTDRQIKIYSQPTSRIEDPAYLICETYDAATSVPLVIAGKLVAEIPVSDLLSPLI